MVQLLWCSEPGSCRSLSVFGRRTAASVRAPACQRLFLHAAILFRCISISPLSVHQADLPLEAKLLTLEPPLMRLPLPLSQKQHRLCSYLLHLRVVSESARSIYSVHGNRTVAPSPPPARSISSFVKHRRIHT